MQNPHYLRESILYFVIYEPHNFLLFENRIQLTAMFVTLMAAHIPAQPLASSSTNKHPSNTPKFIPPINIFIAVHKCHTLCH